jgi:hypothetical protein
MIMLTIRNEKTQRVYTVDETGWAAIEKKGWASRYTVLDKRQVAEAARTTFIPDEIAAEASAAAAKAIQDGLNKGTTANEGDKR